MPHPTAVYLICVADKKWITWHLLQTEPTYFGDSVFSSSPLRSHPTLMTAQREGDFCVVTWFDATKSSPLAAGAARVRLEHGGKFAFANREYAVWTQIEDAPWGEFSLPCTPEVLYELDSMTYEQRLDAAHRFLSSPNGGGDWYDEFVLTTGFVAYRDGKIPRARDITVTRVDDGFLLSWEVRVWNMFSETWLPNRECQKFTRLVRGGDLLLLRDFHTILSHLPAEMS